MESPTPFAGSLIQWGQSGSFYPVLLPGPQSREELTDLQIQIANQSPAAKLSKDLHATFFYLKPPKLYQKLRELQPNLDEARLYNELVTTMASITLVMHMYPFDTVVKNIERFGPGDKMVALELEDMGIREAGRQLLRRNLGWAGFTKAQLDALAEDPDYMWVFGPSNMHISLATDVDDLDTTRLTLPERVTFNGLGDGGVQAPGEDVEERLRWYLSI